MLLRPKALLKQDTLTTGLKCLTFPTVLRGTLGTTVPRPGPAKGSSGQASTCQDWQWNPEGRGVTSSLPAELGTRW